MIRVTDWRMTSFGSLSRWSRVAGTIPPPIVDPPVTPPSTLDEEISNTLSYGGFVLMTTIPSASNTGVGILRTAPTGTAWVNPTPDADHTTADFMATSNGQQVKDKIINGCVDTMGFNDVVFENCIIKGTTLTSGAGMIVKTGESHRTRIQFSEIYSAPGHVGAMGIGVGNFISLRNNIHHTSDAHRVSPVNTGGSASQDTPWNSVIEGNYIHDTLMVTPDVQTRTDKKSHSDALVQLETGDNVRIRGNRSTGLKSTDGTSNVNWTTSSSPYTAVAAGTANAIAYIWALSSIMISPPDGVILKNIQIIKNWLGGGEVTINGAHDLDSTSRVSDNVFDDNSLTGTAIWQKSAMAAGVLVNNKYTDGTNV